MNILEVNKSKVEIRQFGTQYGVFSLQNIEQGETVYGEHIEVSHILTIKDMCTPASDSCFLVRKIFEYPSSAGKRFRGLDLKPIRGLYEKPSISDKKYLKATAVAFNVSYKKVLEIWRIICAYQVITTYKPPTPSYLRYRIQLSNFFNHTNHSCAPNAQGVGFFTSIREFESEITITKALRPIKKGEEIRFLYLGDPNFVELDVKARRRDLKNEYGFICMCERCLAESKL
jgi:hypothetical protein